MLFPMNLSILTGFFVFVLSVYAVSEESIEAFVEDEKLADQDLVVGGELEVGEYCAAFNLNYQYYCKGIWTPDKIRKNRRILNKISGFCPSYKKACLIRGRGPKEYDKERQKEHTKEIKEEIGDLPFDDLMRRIQEVTPCRPNCNIQLHPHCTRKCKCQYEYKRVKKWCDVSDEVERFKYFCRIWYMSCSEYIDDMDPDMAEKFAQAYNPRSRYYGQSSYYG